MIFIRLMASLVTPRRMALPTAKNMATSSGVKLTFLYRRYMRTAPESALNNIVFDERIPFASSAIYFLLFGRDANPVGLRSPVASGADRPSVFHPISHVGVFRESHEMMRRGRLSRPVDREGGAVFLENSRAPHLVGFTVPRMVDFRHGPGEHEFPHHAGEPEAGRRLETLDHGFTPSRFKEVRSGTTFVPFSRST